MGNITPTTIFSSEVVASSETTRTRAAILAEAVTNTGSESNYVLNSDGRDNADDRGGQEASMPPTGKIRETDFANIEAEARQERLRPERLTKAGGEVLYDEQKRTEDLTFRLTFALWAPGIARAVRSVQRADLVLAMSVLRARKSSPQDIFCRVSGKLYKYSTSTPREKEAGSLLALTYKIEITEFRNPNAARAWLRDTSNMWERTSRYSQWRQEVTIFSLDSRGSSLPCLSPLSIFFCRYTFLRRGDVDRLFVSMIVGVGARCVLSYAQLRVPLVCYFVLLFVLFCCFALGCFFWGGGSFEVVVLVLSC